MRSLPIDQLIFKGTHNSYSCVGNDAPRMNHPLNKQIDDFGVWSLELDFSVVLEKDFQFRAIVGHDGPGDATCWGYYFIDFIRMIRPKTNPADAGSLALIYRPIFINFDIKTWGLTDRAFTIAQQDIESVFGKQNVIALEDFVTKNNRYPTVPELAGKAVIYAPNSTNSLPGTWADRCTGPAKVAHAIETGDPLEDEDDDARPCRRAPAPNGAKAPCRVLRLDQYQADWTFEYGVPPNPLVVDWTTQPPWTVMDSEGEGWGPYQNGDVSRGQIVHEQGTFRFPYKTIVKAIRRAEGKPSKEGEPVPNATPDPRRAGYGWTVLIRPGNYPEKLVINVPLTLKKDDRFSGTVVIGR